jgi:hypothetical protein
MSYNNQQQNKQINLNNPRRYISQLYVIPAVDASEAGKGQLEISVNQGQVPNNVQMQGFFIKFYLKIYLKLKKMLVVVL